MGYGDNAGVYVGRDLTVNGGDVIGHITAAPAPRSTAVRVDVGILTVINEEMRAVADVLTRMPGYRTDRLPATGQLVHWAGLPVPAGMLNLVAMQTLDRGPRATVSAYHRLVDAYRPAVVLLVGIAGAIGRQVRIGDVVLGDEIIYYDARRETAQGPSRRGQSYTVPSAVGHRVNEFFAGLDDVPADIDGTAFRVLRGPIGSGDAVITDAGSPIRAWLAEYHEKTLAVDTEAAGVAQAYHEHAGAGHRPQGYLVIRGLSDTADAAKGHRDHALASRRAAATMRMVLPHLVFGATRG